MKPSSTDRDEVDVLSHYGCELMAVVLCPCFTERMRKSTYGVFVALVWASPIVL